MRKTKQDLKDPFFEEYRKARMRIGEGGEQRIRWLIDVANAEGLSTLPIGSLLNVRFELLVFSGEAVGAITMQPETLRPDEALHDLKPFQAQIQSMLTAIVDNRLLPVQFHELRLMLMPASPEDPRLPWTKEVSKNRTYQIFDLLSTYAHQIRRCPRCEKYFLADRKNKNFCSDRCRTQTATYNYRLRRGQITGRRPGRPRKAEATRRKRQPITNKGGAHE